LLLEEPWQGLEDRQKRAIQQYLLEQLPHTTVMVVSNDAEFASKCDQQIVIV
jgi:ABC-type transport system involved in cytochrome bd biosynthesis fused ATPase/permease subunit